MKKSTKLLALFLAVVLTASLFALPASAQSSTKASGSTNYPVVLVHGLLGWGSYDELNKIIPYFGMRDIDGIAYGYTIIELPDDERLAAKITAWLDASPIKVYEEE